MGGTISGLFVYPVKSLGGISLDESSIESRGLRHDRRWMLVDEEGVFLSQRSDPSLATFRTAILPDGLEIQNSAGEKRTVPFEPTGSSRCVQIWKDTCEAVQVCPEADRWLSKSLDRPCSLVYMADREIRHTNPAFTLPGDQVGFADGYPILVISDGSLKELNGRLAEPIPMNRFRPNIVVDGWSAHAEDEWPILLLGGVVLRAAKQCARCAVPAIDQDTGRVGVDPLRALARYRLQDKKIYFGAFFVPETLGMIRRGQEVAAVGRRQPLAVF